MLCTILRLTPVAITNEYLVCHRSKKRIKNVEGLNDLEVIVAADSSYIYSLEAYPDMFWAAAKNDIDSSLLAAQSYQESHWDRKAKSPTGVRGIVFEY